MEKQAKKARGLMREFKEFISRGNVVDLAVGVIVGTSFTAIVNSLVNDIVMPAVGCLIGGINFTGLKLVITPATASTAEAAIYYGNFIQSVVNFLSTALVVFIMVKAINSFHKKKETPPPEPPKPSEEVLLLQEIRDLLKEQNMTKQEGYSQERE